MVIVRNRDGAEYTGKVIMTFPLNEESNTTLLICFIINLYKRLNITPVWEEDFDVTSGDLDPNWRFDSWPNNRL
jgi:hypothetical protein